MYVQCKIIPGLIENRFAVKTLNGRDRKHHGRFKCLYLELIFEFDRLKSINVRLKSALIQKAAFALSEEGN